MSVSNSESLTQDTKEESEDQKAFSMEKDAKNKGVEDSEKMAVTVMDIPMEVEKGTVGDSGASAVADILKSKKEVKWCSAMLGLRIVAFAFCLTAFSVLAADKYEVLLEESPLDYIYTHKYLWYTFSWNDYDEFKFSFTANVIGFVYSLLQIVDLVRYLITKKHIINPKLRGYFDTAMDQVLAYVLLSASSSAATAAHLYRIVWVGYGANVFIEMANASVALSFLAFVAFALASIVSGFILCRFN